LGQGLKQGFITMLQIGSYGRFCNALYQVAGILGIAKKNNLEPVFPQLINYCHRDQFGSTEDVNLYKHFVFQLPPIPDGTQWQALRNVEWGYHDIRLHSGNWSLSGHFQSPKYFDNCREEVSHYFRMIDEPPQNDFCAVHIRLGDYDDGYHPRLRQNYYGPAMLRMRRWFPEIKFLVFSDDITEAKKRFGNDVEFSEGLDYIQDFKLMKTCRHFIIGNSSYSAMAAILGDASDKRVIAPRPWFGAKYAQISGDDIYDADWDVVQWDSAQKT
jgi:hypothetical protein